jgi:hypothetical protein
MKKYLLSYSVLALLIGLLSGGCSMFYPPPPQTSAAEPSLAGVLLSNSYVDIRHKLKDEGYIIASRAVSGPEMRLTFVNSDRGALFPSLELTLCQEGNVPLSLICLGYDSARVLREAEHRLALAEYNRVSDLTRPTLEQALDSAQKFYQERVFVFQDLRGGAFSLEEDGVYALYLENSAQRQTCGQRELAGRQREGELFDDIQEKLDQ